MWEHTTWDALCGPVPHFWGLFTGNPTSGARGLKAMRLTAPRGKHWSGPTCRAFDQITQTGKNKVLDKIVAMFWWFFWLISAYFHTAAKGTPQKEPGKRRPTKGARQRNLANKVTKKVTETLRLEKVTEKRRKRKKMTELLLPHSLCGTLFLHSMNRPKSWRRAFP